MALNRGGRPFSDAHYIALWYGVSKKQIDRYGVQRFMALSEDGPLQVVVNEMKRKGGPRDAGTDHS